MHCLGFQIKKRIVLAFIARGKKNYTAGLKNNPKSWQKSPKKFAKKTKYWQGRIMKFCSSPKKPKSAGVANFYSNLPALEKNQQLNFQFFNTTKKQTKNYIEFGKILLYFIKYIPNGVLIIFRYYCEGMALLPRTCRRYHSFAGVALPRSHYRGG